MIFQNFLLFIFVWKANSHFNDICGPYNGKRFYLESGESGSLLADTRNNAVLQNKNVTLYNKCTVEFITCPSCVIEIQFGFLNISRNCGKASVFDTCGCDYIWIYEPQIEDGSGEQFCGRFVKSNTTELSYVSQTRTVAFTFIYNYEYGHAFTLDYFTKRNRLMFWGYPKAGNMNNGSQFISSPFFPHLYPIDLSVEYVINCESIEPCRISLLFTDFLLDASSIVEFFDWNGQRMYVISGNVFRPPVIISNGPSLVIRFFANGASHLGFKATYSFILGNIHELAFKPFIGCGGNVNNLGGGITMMNMVTEGTTLFDCVWIVKPPENLRHRKTHLYVKVATFLEFAGTTELTIKQGITSNQPSVEVLRYPAAHHNGNSKQPEHVAPITQGFYIRLRGIFTPISHLAIIYAAFNYKDCYGGSDFLCHNMRCISILLNCDGFDHCGDDSDETNCFQDPKDHRDFSKIPNFLFPKSEPYSDITTATFVFLTCSFGLIGIILAMAVLLYRVNIRAEHHRQIQDHIETIHAILEESVGDIEEEIIVPDEPPDYEPPPEYNELLKMKYFTNFPEMKKYQNRCSKCSWKSQNVQSQDLTEIFICDSITSNASTSQICCSSPSIRIPDSPPPAYNNLPTIPLGNMDNNNDGAATGENIDTGNIEFGFSNPGPSFRNEPVRNQENSSDEVIGNIAAKYFENLPKYSSQIFNEIKKGIRSCKSMNFLRTAKRAVSFSEENLVRYFSDSELIFNSRVNINSGAEGFRFRKSFSSSALSSV